MAPFAAFAKAMVTRHSPHRRSSLTSLLLVGTTGSTTTRRNLATNPPTTGRRLRTMRAFSRLVICIVPLVALGTTGCDTGAGKGSTPPENVTPLPEHGPSAGGGGNAGQKNANAPGKALTA